jgi:hypothetical protein
VELDQLDEDQAPLADRRGVIEHAGLSLEQRLFELDVLAQMEEGAGAGRLDPLVDRLGNVVDDVTDVVNRPVVHWPRT